MEERIFFSPGEIGFYPYSMKGSYDDAGTWPDDVVELTGKEKAEYWTIQPPKGMQLGINANNRPVWIEVMPQLHEQSIEQAESKKQLLITEANQKTQLWQTQLMLGIITGEDKTSLTEWMLYVQKVQAVDTSAAPDIIWPEKPE